MNFFTRKPPPKALVLPLFFFLQALDSPAQTVRCHTDNGKPVDGVTLNVRSLDGQLEVTPSKDDNPLNGVTTYDLVLISKHILGTEPFDSPYKMIAADANKSGSITSHDIVELRKLILGIYTEFSEIYPEQKSWRFVKKTQTLQMPNPFQDAFEESIKADREASPLPTHDFVAIKVGDVNNTASANRPSGERPQAALHFPEIKGQPGEVLTVPVVYGSGAPLQAMQFGLRFDPARLELIGPSLGDLPEWGSGAFNLSRTHEGELRTLWLPDLSGPNPLARPGDVLFHLSFRVRPTGLSGEGEHLWLDDALLHCAAWSGEGEEHALVPVAAKATVNAPSPGGGATLTATCHPNPGTGDLALSVVLPRPGKCRAALYSPFGVRLLAKDVALGAGAHEIPLDGAAQLPAGVYVWKVFSNGELAQGHWIKQ